MERIKELFLTRNILLTEKEKLTLEIKIKENLTNLPKNIKQKNYKEIIETYNLLKNDNYIQEREKCYNFLVEEISLLLKNDNLITLRKIIDSLCDDFLPIISNKLINYFTNKVNSFRKDLLAHDTYEMYQLFLNLDSNNRYNLQTEMNNILIKNINLFLKKGDLLLKNDHCDLLAIDRWLEECYLFMELRVELKSNELRQLISKLEMYYLSKCIDLVFTNDKIHGSKDLIFLVKRIHKRQNNCKLGLEESIKNVVYKSDLLNDDEKEDLCRILELKNE